MRKFFFALIIFMFAVSVCLNIGMYRHIQTGVVRSDTVYKEKVVEVKDTTPGIMEEKVIDQVSIPVHSNSPHTGKIKAVDNILFEQSRENKTDSTCLFEKNRKNKQKEADSATLLVVQRKYTDDSTYTAYVSGLRYNIYPRLDSVIVRQKIIERTVTNNIYRNRNGLKVKLRPAIGGGYDPLNRQWGVYIGGALVLDW